MSLVMQEIAGNLLIKRETTDQMNILCRYTVSSEIKLSRFFDVEIVQISQVQVNMFKPFVPNVPNEQRKGVLGTNGLMEDRILTKLSLEKSHLTIL